MIKCTGCLKYKDTDQFYKNKNTGTFRTKCKSCISEQGYVWRDANKERKSSSDRLYRLNNKDKLKVKASNHFRLNKDRYALATAKRKAAKLKATPEWLTEVQLAEIEYIYFLRKDASLLSDYDYHVDHIVPLQGKEVCGLHVPWNLQLLPKEVNYAKNNRL